MARLAEKRFKFGIQVQQEPWFRSIYLVKIHLEKSIWEQTHCFTTWKVCKCEVFSGPYFPVFGLNANLRIQSEYGKIRTTKNFLFGHFSHTVSFQSTLLIESNYYLCTWFILPANAVVRKCSVKIKEIEKRSKIQREISIILEPHSRVWERICSNWKPFKNDKKYFFISR